MKKLLLVISLLFCFSLSYAGLSIDPSVTNVFGQPNSSYQGKYLVKNTYDRDINITLNVEQGNTFSANKDVDVNKWLKFEKYKYFIKAEETIEVPYTVLIDEKFQGSISSKISFAVDQEEGQMISITITVPIYVTVEGTENVDFDIDSINLYNNSRDNNINYKLIVENKGNVHIRHSGNIELYKKNKKNLVNTISIPETVPTYCESKRDFADTLIPLANLKKGKYIAVFKIRALGKEAIKEIKFKVSKKGVLKILK